MNLGLVLTFSKLGSFDSFKKVDSNVQGAQSRVTGPGPHPNVNLGSSNSSTFARAVQNGAHIQPPLRGMFGSFN